MRNTTRIASLLAAFAAGWVSAQDSLAIRAVSFVHPDGKDSGTRSARLVVLAGLTDESLPRTTASLEVRVISGRDRVVASRSDSFDLRAGPTDLVTSVVIPSGRYRVEGALRAGDRVATGSTSIDIPNYTWDALSMSDIVFSSDASRVSLADTARGLLPLAPVARPVFRGGDRVSVFARLYASPTAILAPVIMTATIARPGEGERPVFTDRTPATIAGGSGQRTSDYRLWLPLDRLGGGEWTLRLHARSEVRYTATREVTFTVR
jgi:hypothetical protein